MDILDVSSSRICSTLYCMYVYSVLQLKIFESQSFDERLTLIEAY